MSEQTTDRNVPDEIEGQEGTLASSAEHVDVEVRDADLGDVETAEPARQTSGDSYETPDELGGTGGPDAGGAG